MMNTHASLKFQVAKTMPEIPHQYVRRSPDNEVEYVELFHKIAKYGVWEEFQGKPYQYYYPGDEFKYWRMTDNLAQSRIINRAKVERGMSTPQLPPRG